jgi:hypothetical protein
MRTNDSCGRLAKQADFLLLLRMELSRGVQEICNSQNSRVTRDETKDAPITLRPERAATEDGERQLFGTVADLHRFIPVAQPPSNGQSTTAESFDDESFIHL